MFHMVCNQRAYINQTCLILETNSDTEKICSSACNGKGKPNIKPCQQDCGSSFLEVECFEHRRQVVEAREDDSVCGAIHAL